MTTATSLFNQITARGFADLRSEIAGLQARISEGTNDPRPSADPVRAARLSALEDQNVALAVFRGNVAVARDRLGRTDAALSDLTGLVRSLQQVAIRAGNATLGPAGLGALRAETQGLRAALLTAANGTDSAGRALFSGLAPGLPFQTGPGGRVAYAGDGGATVARLSESVVMPTAIAGDRALMAVPTAAGARSLFDIAADLATALDPDTAALPLRVAAEGGATLRLPDAVGARTLSFRLEGPAGAVTIGAELTGAGNAPLVDAINARMAETGVTAAAAPDGGVVLSAGGPFALAEVRLGDTPATPVLLLETATGVAPLRDARLGVDDLLGQITAAVDHLATLRAEAGALGAEVDRRETALIDRQVLMDEAVAGLRDLDVAAAITRLQTLLTTEQAAQQTFVKISQGTLFDYIR